MLPISTQSSVGTPRLESIKMARACENGSEKLGNSHSPRGDGQSSRGLTFVETTLPEPLINPSLLGPLLMAPETRTPVRISYQSMTTGQPSGRIISPHTIVRASRRFHVRAWDSLRKTFSDFSLARITAS